MIITKKTPYTKEEIKKLKEQFGSYIKTVIDLERKICSAGIDLHVEGEEILLKKDCQQKNVWGEGVDLETKTIDFNSMINIRPNNQNFSNVIENQDNQQKYRELTQYFFKLIYESN